MDFQVTKDGEIIPMVRDDRLGFLFGVDWANRLRIATHVFAIL